LAYIKVAEITNYLLGYNFVVADDDDDDDAHVDGVRLCL
jgi:hypothetical protein